MEEIRALDFENPTRHEPVSSSVKKDSGYESRGCFSEPSAITTILCENDSRREPSILLSIVFLMILSAMRWSDRRDPQLVPSSAVGSPHAPFGREVDDYRPYPEVALHSPSRRKADRGPHSVDGAVGGLAEEDAGGIRRCYGDGFFDRDDWNGLADAAVLPIVEGIGVLPVPVEYEAPARMSRS